MTIRADFAHDGEDDQKPSYDDEDDPEDDVDEEVNEILGNHAESGHTEDHEAESAYPVQESVEEADDDGMGDDDVDSLDVPSPRTMLGVPSSPR